ncbi:hypothetical protein GobsT_41110 [Gemmata obscuriglobus]|nr:hypothetical protein GobsT_41110 [Gemmata obscuriglobus]VTS08303.1 unnamed protein product [Gemmata obscuriglobus UQM 2246]
MTIRGRVTRDTAVLPTGCGSKLQEVAVGDGGVISREGDGAGESSDTESD